MEITLDNLFNWFCNNSFKTNASKCHLFLSPFNAKFININSSLIVSSSSKTFLGITTDSKFTFEKHINGLCKKRNLELPGLTRCATFMSTGKGHLIFKAVLILQSNYCSLSMDVPYKTTKQSNQQSARKGVKSNISR